MPNLNWIGKKAVLNHHREVPFHLLKCDKALSVGDADSGNLLVQGDNLLALKALLPYYAGKIKCIYIDPPYNTGNENWVYNDAVNSPEMKNWLGKVVGAETEDLSRHDKWLCMMYPRLSLLREFLSLDGAIFISIDDNEAANLRLIMDEIFGTRNFLCTFAWEKRYGPPPDTKDIGYVHETIIAYRKSASFVRNLLPVTHAQIGRYKNPDNDPRGPWKPMDYTCRYSRKERPNLFYSIRRPKDGMKIYPSESRVWAFSEDQHKLNEKENRLWWGKYGTGNVPALKNFLTDVQKGIMPVSLLGYEEVGHTHEATQELKVLVPTVKMTPKPSRLIAHLVQIGGGRDSMILDSFAGSGTTGQAVLELNKQDGGSRKFILVEMDKDICQNVTAQRLRKVVEGYTVEKNGKTTIVPGLGGGFRFCRLGEPIFDELGNIRGSIGFSDLAAHVYFTETGSPLPKQGKVGTPFLGVHEGRGIYLLYNGILGDKKPDGGNVLTLDVLRGLPNHSGHKVIYGEACRLGEARLRQERIVFKQIPYQIKVN